jgi:hypothetical protein
VIGVDDELARPKAFTAADVCASIPAAGVGDQDVRHGRIRDAGEIWRLALAVADRAEEASSAPSRALATA